jgi:CheY-like chemotaxis protein
MPSVLLVDDDPTVRQIVGRSLQGMGFDIREAGSGEEALAALADVVPDVMILDLLMPSPNGLIILEELRRTGLSARVPILVITGSVTPEATIREAGARGVLRKPFTAAQLRGTMKGLVAHRALNHERPPETGWFARHRRPPCVLIVEDDQEASQMLETLLRLEGYVTVTASNGVDALASLRTRRPCAVVLDLMLPVMDGWQFRQEQLQEPAIADVPVICITGVGNPVEVESQLGTPCFAKPFDVEAVLRAIKQCV